ncbi:uncharacterized protein PHACADRAFT_207540 [Phanerochaete carnosa HHB-10118-sp]|uniref:Uncharacterized protein n=1 Tax=Phanerochaete carnosa (strain HHB-10118-sp) TaxID=650164 RepID=K5V191_PHACS|nr:uncharacterized protein PHACADRAFT_207540 [Phanerochaete carnosa HHB-10118-sp]EKM56256.1 hypothetical protein PHACADRAFT_207540 [Phanerochaete carnosa HHB-10118-sp]
MSAYPDEATLVPRHAAPTPALKAAKAKGRGRPKGPKRPPSKGTQTKPGDQENTNPLSTECIQACARRYHQIEREGPTPPGCPDDWYWHDNCHTRRRRQPTLEGGKLSGDDIWCKPGYNVQCRLALLGEPCFCFASDEVAVFDMD